MDDLVVRGPDFFHFGLPHQEIEHSRSSADRVAGLMLAPLPLMAGQAVPAGLRRKHADTRLNEFVFRFNRRYHRKASFETPLGIALKAPTPQLGHHRRQDDDL